MFCVLWGHYAILSVSRWVSLSSLPPLIRDAVIEAQQITQAPGACGSICPGRCFTCLPESDWCLQTEYTAGPVSLFLLTLAESGERKTAVDKLLMEPLYQQEMLLYSRHKNELTTWKNKEELLKAQKKHCCQNWIKNSAKARMSQKRSDNWKRFRKQRGKTCKI